MDQRATLMGGSTGQYNLAAVRTRAEELRRSVQEVVEALGGKAHELQWEGVLKKSADLNLRMQALREQLRGLLKQVVVYPRMVDNPGTAHALPIQLASKLTPEMEARDAELVRALEAGPLLSPHPPDSHYELIGNQLDEFNRLVGGLTGPGGPLDPKGTARKDVALSSQIIKATIAAAQAAAAVASLPVLGGAGTRSGAGGKRARSGGGAGAPGEALDPILMSLLTGEGLRPDSSKAQRR
mmetsp:Transcript_16128/g.34905  ORF Transcript_16128/g.34905 Transcript_16128/m.34905 type:complete len:240 (+) Transcript_16128:236-955(+)